MYGGYIRNDVDVKINKNELLRLMKEKQKILGTRYDYRCLCNDMQSRGLNLKYNGLMSILYKNNWKLIYAMVIASILNTSVEKLFTVIPKK